MPDTGNQITAWSLVSLLAGTVISSIVAYLLQRRSFAEAREQKERDGHKQREALAFSLFVKMSKIASNINTLRRYVNDALDAAKKKGTAPWQIFLPPANKFAAIEFKAEEMAVLLSMDSKLFNEMMPWDAIHNTIVDLFALYGTKRQALTDTFSAEMKGNLETSTFTKEEILKIAPRAAELNGLIEQMHGATSNDSKTSWDLLKKLFEALKIEFDMPYELGRNPLV